ncbi:serine palmitoyltransferase component [Taxawa tesnikishii (nom. ined.)]|nr:serine palmitoyltransferase component [Dothideales sp. JES 119]
MNSTSDYRDASSAALHYVHEAIDQFQKVPGSSIIVRYIRSSYQNDPVRSAAKNVPLTDQEIDELVEEWTPEPLASDLTPFEVAENEKGRPSGPKCRLANGRTVTNLASFNHYNFIGNDTIKEKAVATLRTYGVGPCGPPGFYGTQDVHAALEADIAAHLGSPAAIVYAQSFSTISSVIPAFAKRGDIIVADKAVNYAIRKGLQISRCTVHWYEHNDMSDLERVLAKVVKEQARKKLTRRFIVTEGLFENVGDVVDLPKVVELKHRYKFRIILDETWSYGILGRTGRGVTEQQNVDAREVDMITGSLASALCAGGGFCAGTEEIVEHQRLSSNAYTFSAALPAMLATTASETVRMLQEQPEHITSLRENIKAMRAQLDPRSDWVMCQSAADNPIMLLVLKKEVIESRKLGIMEQEQLLQDAVDECLRNDVLVTRLKAMPQALGVTPTSQGWQPQPAIKVCVTNGLTKKEIEKAGVVIRHAITKVMTRRK